MKIKGFWKGYVDLCKESIKWLKDYWLLYTIICIIWAVIWFLPDMIREHKARKAFKEKYNDDFDDFLNW